MILVDREDRGLQVFVQPVRRAISGQGKKNGESGKVFEIHFAINLCP
jgi:hypothetical protein